MSHISALFSLQTFYCSLQVEPLPRVYSFTPFFTMSFSFVWKLFTFIFFLGTAVKMNYPLPAMTQCKHSLFVDFFHLHKITVINLTYCQQLIPPSIESLDVWVGHRFPITIERARRLLPDSAGYFGAP
jgi:hypothetical protein